VRASHSPADAEPAADPGDERPRRPARQRAVDVPAEPRLDEVRAMLAGHGIRHVAVTSAEVLTRARASIIERKAAGLHDGMAFTFRNPQRSTDPQRSVEGARSVIVAA